jgi:predicted RNase H-like nuclease
VVVIRDLRGRPPLVRIEKGGLKSVFDDQSLAIVAIDIPIGLLRAAVRGGRACDQDARAFVGARYRSVFSAPVRACLTAKNREEADKRSRASSEDDMGVSAQCWGITPKIAEVDRLITPALQTRVVEVHPEVCFAAMNGDRPLGHGKTSREGRAERCALLRAKWNCDVDRIASERRPGAKADDVLDAMAAAWTAERVLRGAAQRFSTAVSDGRGLRMEIVR